MIAHARLVSMIPLVALALVTSACDLLMTEPAPADSEVGLFFQVTPAPIGGEAAAFSRINRVALRFVRADSSMRDTTLHVTPQDGLVRTVISLEPIERITALGIGAELRSGIAPLFQGATVAAIQPGTPTTVEISLLPIPAFVRADRSNLSLASVASATQLSSAVLFATMDTIPGLQGVWFSDDPTIVTVTPEGLAVAARMGATQLVVEFGALADTVPVQVVAPF